MKVVIIINYKTEQEQKKRKDYRETDFATWERQNDKV
jgi:hypothetical protein